MQEKISLILQTAEAVLLFLKLTIRQKMAGLLLYQQARWKSDSCRLQVLAPPIQAIKENRNRFPSGLVELAW